METWLVASGKCPPTKTIQVGEDTVVVAEETVIAKTEVVVAATESKYKGMRAHHTTVVPATKWERIVVGTVW